jgi:hypothetical protein
MSSFQSTAGTSTSTTAAAERWAARQQNAPKPSRDINRDLGRDHSLGPENQHARERTRDGPEDDL